MQSLQNQFVKEVAVHGVHIIAPCKVYNMYPQPPQFSKLFTMQKETTDYCCQNVFENQSLTSHHVATKYNGEQYYAVVY